MLIRIFFWTLLHSCVSVQQRMSRAQINSWVYLQYKSKVLCSHDNTRLVTIIHRVVGQFRSSIDFPRHLTIVANLPGSMLQSDNTLRRGSVCSSTGSHHLRDPFWGIKIVRQLSKKCIGGWIFQETRPDGDSLRGMLPHYNISALADSLFRYESLAIFEFHVFTSL